MELILKCHGISGYEIEYRFHPPRRWRFDFAWLDRKLAVEVDGGEWSRGRHTRGKGFSGDCEKMNQATIDGWRVLRFTGSEIRKNHGSVIAMIVTALNEDESCTVRY
jgi:very-short-patch-repair endonuclease